MLVEKLAWRDAELRTRDWEGEVLVLFIEERLRVVGAPSSIS